MNSRHSLITTLALAILLIAGSAFAQELRLATVPVACPHPVSITLSAPPPSPPTPDPHDFSGTLATAVAGSVWNQTAINKSFGHTFHFPAPDPGKECCLMTTGTLTVTVKCLQGGGSNSSTSGNDDVEIIGAPALNARVWPTGCTTGATRTLTMGPIPANVLSTGRVSLYVEDDTAVLSAKLTLEGCCLK